MIQGEENYKYKKFFDKTDNEIFHKQLEFHMSKEIERPMKKYIQHKVDKGELQVEDVNLFTKFFIGGQMAVINCNEEEFNDKIEFLSNIINAFKK